MRRNSRYTPEIRAEVEQLRAKGFSFRALGAKYGVSSTTVRSWLGYAVRPVYTGSSTYHTTMAGAPVPEIPSFTPQPVIDVPGLPPLERSALWARLSEPEREAMRARIQRGEPIR